MKIQNLINARSSAFMLCDYLDAAIRNHAQGHAKYERSALLRATKVLDDIVAAIENPQMMKD